jgi:hypothetical protein
MITHLAIAVVAGFLVKIVDWLDDERKSKSPVKYVFAIAYGVLLGYIIGTASFAGIFLAALVAQVFARKIDTPAHELGFVTALFTLLFLDIPGIELTLFAYFMVLAFLDEVDFIGKLRPLTECRPFLKVGSLALVLIGRWDYFAGIIAFDIGYDVFSILKKYIK